MSNVKRITDLLEGKFFKWHGEQYFFKACKSINYNIMILTNSKTLQIHESDVENFIKTVEPTITSESKELKSFVPQSLPVQELGIMIPETPSIFKRLNQSFDSLLNEIEGASDEKLKVLELKSKMLTSMAQSAVSMENSRNKLIELINK